MTPVRCPICNYSTNIFSLDIKHEECPMCGEQMEIIEEKKAKKSNPEHVKKHVDEILVENMIAYIKEQGEDLVWNNLNTTKLEYRLDDLACFFEAKARMK